MDFIKNNNHITVILILFLYFSFSNSLNFQLTSKLGFFFLGLLRTSFVTNFENHLQNSKNLPLAKVSTLWIEVQSLSFHGSCISVIRYWQSNGPIAAIDQIHPFVFLLRHSSLSEPRPSYHIPNWKP